jgi:hypothetical protein
MDMWTRFSDQRSSRSAEFHVHEWHILHNLYMYIHRSLYALPTPSVVYSTISPSLRSQSSFRHRLRRQSLRGLQLRHTHRALGPRLPQCIRNLDNLVLRAGHTSRNKHNPILLVDLQHFQILDRNALVTHISRHALSRKNTRSRTLRTTR